MATFNKIQSFVAALANKVHNLGSDVMMVALTNTIPLASNTQLSNITEISYVNLSSRTLTTVSSLQTAGTYKFILSNLVLTATGAVPTFQYVVIYNNTATNKELLGWYDNGSAITLGSGDTYTVVLDATNGTIQLV